MEDWHPPSLLFACADADCINDVIDMQRFDKELARAPNTSALKIAANVIDEINAQEKDNAERIKRIQNGSGFRRAHTPTFAFETAAVHAGPGISHIPGPYPRFLTSHVFFLLCAADLDPSKIAKHRADNGLAGGANLAFAIP